MAQMSMVVPPTGWDTSYCMQPLPINVKGGKLATSSAPSPFSLLGKHNSPAFLFLSRATWVHHLGSTYGLTSNPLLKG